MQINRTPKAVLALSASLVLSLANIHAGTSGKVPVGKGSPAADAPASPWDITAAGGFSLTDGNNDTLSAYAQFLATYVADADELTLGADYLYGENNGLKTADSLRAYAGYNRLLTDSFYLGLNAFYARDSVADLDSRVGVVPTLGVYLLKSDTTRLALEAGAGYIWEDQGGLSADYVALRFAEKFEHKLTATSKLWQSVAYVPEAEDFGNYFLEAELGLAVQLSGHWQLRTFVRDTYDSTPAAGAEKNDVSVIAALAYSLGGFPEEAPAGRKSLKPAKAKAAVAPMGWTATAGAGFLLTDGNADNLGVSADISSAFRSETDELLLSAGGAYAEASEVTTTQNVRAAGQYNRLFGPALYGGIGTSFLHNDLSAVDYRVTPAAVLGAYLVKSDDVSLSIEAGPGYTFEKVAGVKSDFFVVQGAQRLALRLTDSITLGQEVVGTLATDDTDNWTIAASAFLEADITESLALRVAVTDLYDNQPGAGLDENDLLLSSGVAVRF